MVPVLPSLLRMNASLWNGRYLFLRVIWITFVLRSFVLVQWSLSNRLVNIARMASQEGCLDEALTQQDANPSPMEWILKELTELRKGNQKLNDRLHCVLQRPTAKKSLFRSNSRSSVDPSCSVGTNITCTLWKSLINVRGYKRYYRC